MHKFTVAMLLGATVLASAPDSASALNMNSALKYCDRDYECRIAMRRLDLMESYADYSRALDKEIASYDRRAKFVCKLAGTSIDQLSGGAIKKLVKKAYRISSLRQASNTARKATKSLYLDLREVEAGLNNQRARRYIQRARHDAR